MNPKNMQKPQIPPGGRLIKVEGSQAEQLAKETYHRVQPHLNELNQENAAHQSAISLVFSAAIRQHGVNAVNGELFAPCLELAKKLAEQNLRSTHEKARELFLELKLGDVPAHIRRAAARSGVEMPTPGDFLPPVPAIDPKAH